MSQYNCGAITDREVFGAMRPGSQSMHKRRKNNNWFLVAMMLILLTTAFLVVYLKK